MDKDRCPICKNYNLKYDIYFKKAVCSHVGCGFKEEMSKDAYILLYSNLDSEDYNKLPEGLRKRIEEIANFHNRKKELWERIHF